MLLPVRMARWIADNLHSRYPAGDPHWVPEDQRLDDDLLDPDSVANPNGDDLSWVTPDEGDLIDLEAL